MTPDRRPEGAAAVVLAAGAGSRYGMPKVLAEEGDWLRRAVQAAVGGGCDEVVVVLGAAAGDEVAPPPPARAVYATGWRDGLSASLRAGLGELSGADAGYVVIQLVDTPDVDAAVVARVLAMARATPSGLARAMFAGTPGHPVVIARRHWAALLVRLHGDVGAGPFLRGRDDVVEVECGDLATGADIDER
ncbi:nucleotidyltransferase family protein [Mycobacterium sp. NPDC003323]